MSLWSKSPTSPSVEVGTKALPVVTDLASMISSVPVTEVASVSVVFVNDVFMFLVFSYKFQFRINSPKGIHLLYLPLYLFNFTLWVVVN